MPATPETIAKAAIRAALSQSGKLLLWNNPTGFGYSVAGSPISYGLAVGSCDLIGCVIGSGRFFACEVKAGKGKPSPEQRAFIGAVNKAGGYAFVARWPGEALEHLEKARAGVSAPALPSLK
jgi:hypothetical protein